MITKAARRYGDGRSHSRERLEFPPEKPVSMWSIVGVVEIAFSTHW